MRIAITDLTRMRPGFICAAGVDLETGGRVRPVLAREQLSQRMLSTSGGPLDIGNIVDFGECVPRPSAPEIEDVQFDPRNVRCITAMKELDFFELLEASAEKSLEVIGPALKRDGKSLVTECGTGCCSLVILRAPERPRFGLRDRGKGPQLRFDWLDCADLSITDIRLYETDLKTPNSRTISSLEQTIESATRAFLSFGLTRPFAEQGNRHFLQLNNLHVPGWPHWCLTTESPGPFR